MNDVISVIVPVYNVAAYLPQCIESILGQDYEKLEVLLVDDGSRDESGAICDRYAALDSRIRVIHQKNGGAAAAKNAGLRVATGEYLSFLDSDDYLEPGTYRYMADILKSYGADVVQCAFRYVFRDHAEDQIFKTGRSVMSGREYLVCFTKDWTCGLMTDKLFKRALFDGVFFEEGHKIDDEYFTYQGIMNAGKVVCDDRVIYNYRQRASSVMLSPKSREQLAYDRVDCMVKRREKVLKRFPELRREFDIQFLDALIYLAEDPGSSPKSIAFIKTQLKSYLLKKGNTFPPRYFWAGLLRLYFTSTEKLLANRQPGQERYKAEDYFA